MNSLMKVVGIALLLASTAYGASDGIISGTVKGPSGAPLRGVFVQARSVAINNLTVSVLSDNQGHYRIENLSPGEYQIWAKASTYRSDPPEGVRAAAGSSLDLTLKAKKVGWSDLSDYQAYALLPEGKGKQEFKSCMLACHGFVIQERMTPAAWEGIVNYMRAIRSSVNSDPEANTGGNTPNPPKLDFAAALAYVSAVLTVDGPLPKSPADLPGYQKVKHGAFSDEAMKMVYVDYDMPESSGGRTPDRGDVGGPVDFHPGMPTQFPFCAAPDKDGNVWVAYRYLANKIARVNPNTGAVIEFKLPTNSAIHMAVPAPDGTVWFNEIGPDKIAKWDPGTQKITEYQAAAQLDDKGKLTLGYKNAIRIDPKGYVWSSGQPLMRFDPKTEKFKYFLGAPQSTYGLALDKAGNLWFAADEESKIGEVDAETDKLTMYDTPTPKAEPKRMQIDSDGIIWFSEHTAGKIGRFDPKTDTFKEYPLPGPGATPYALGIDRNHQIWYESRLRDVLGRLDPKTGRVTEYPMPYSAVIMREFFLDSQGRLWFGADTQNKVGYFYLATDSGK